MIRTVVFLGTAVSLLATPLAAQTDRGQQTALFARLDRNEDDVIDSADLVAGQEKMLAALIRRGDANGDKQLDRSELAKSLSSELDAKPIEEKRENRLPGADALEVLIAKLDVNRNASIEPDEVPAKWQAAFKQLLKRGNKDGNDTLSRREIARSGPQLARVASQIARQENIDVAAELADLPKSERISAMRQRDYRDQPPSPGELLKDPELLELVFDRLDKDQDGLLARNEIPAERRGLIRLLGRRADRNGDSKLSLAEFKKVLHMAVERQNGVTDRAPRRKKKDKDDS